MATVPPGNNVAAANRERALLHIKALKTLLVSDVKASDVLVQHLRGLRNLINERYAPDIVKEARELSELIDKFVTSLTKEAA